MKPVILVLALAVAAAAQFTVADPNLTATTVASGIPGDRHEIGTDSTGAIYLAEVVSGGWTPTQIHRVDAGGVVTLGFIAQGPMSVGQMVTNPADSLCYFVNHWQGALEHNHILRIETNGSLTLLQDVLWGEAHGFTQDAAGNWYVATPYNFFTSQWQIWMIPAGQLGVVAEVPWAPGEFYNQWLAPETPGSLLLAEGASVVRVQPGQPNLAVFTPTISAGTTLVEWRGLIQSPFGQGHVVSLIETVSGATSVIGRVYWIGPGGPRLLVQTAGPPPGDLGIAGDNQGRLLLTFGNALLRLSPVVPQPQPPGQLLAPTSHPVAQPITVMITGRVFALSPFVLAVDAPLGPPLFPLGVLPIPPFGLAHTSLGILQTFFAVRDGIGAFHVAESQAFIGAGGTFSEAYPLPLQLAGLTLVLQAYILDSLAPNGVLWITPPVFSSFI